MNWLSIKIVCCLLFLLCPKFTAVQSLKLTVDDGIEDGLFGSSLAVHTNHLAVGSMGDHYLNKKHSGSVYIFSRLSDSDAWTLSQKIYPDRVQSYDQFGCSMVMGDDILLVGSLNGKQESNINTGNVFVWSIDSSFPDGKMWTQQSELSPTTLSGYDEFGKEIAYMDNTAVVSAIGDDSMFRDAGAVYVFNRDGVQWSEGGKLVVEDAREDQYFGGSLALYSGGLLVGSLEGKFQNNKHIVTGNTSAGDWGEAERTNTVYFFGSASAHQGAWSLQATLTHGERFFGDQFGWSVALSANVAIVGARYDGGESGGAYTFSRPSGSSSLWTQAQKLLPLDARSGMYFGDSIVLRGESVFIGAYGWMDAEKGGGGAVGCVYMFTTTSSQIQGISRWTQQAQLTAKDRQDDSYFGRSIGYSPEGGSVVVGASSSFENGIGSGAAYSFRYVNGLLEDGYVGNEDTEDASIGAETKNSLTIYVGVSVCVAICLSSTCYYMCCCWTSSHRQRSNHFVDRRNNNSFSCLEGDEEEFKNMRGDYELALVAGDNGTSEEQEVGTNLLGVFQASDGVKSLELTEQNTASFSIKNSTDVINESFSG